MKVRNIKLEGFDGRPFKVNRRVLGGDNVEEDGNIANVLEFTTLNIPPQVATYQDSIHGIRLLNQLKDSLNPKPNRATRRRTQASNNGTVDNIGKVLTIEQAEWDWITQKLQNDSVGPKLFGITISILREQIMDSLIEDDEEEDDDEDEGAEEAKAKTPATKTAKAAKAAAD